MSEKITNLGIDFEVVDVVEQITIADSFIKGGNKIGSGNGEAKLYVGQITDSITIEFFNILQNKPLKCFILKSDLSKYLLDTRIEYSKPTQAYRNKLNMPNLWNERFNSLLTKSEILEFELFDTKVTPPRIYLNCKNGKENYNLIREFALPNLSYLSCLKLRNLNNNEIVYYFKIFADLSYLEEEIITENQQPKARMGQARYRSQLLMECPYCPVTMVNYDRLLIASHIKPFHQCNDYEKYDPKNGLMLTPTIDKLFDKGFISFTNNKEILLSPWMSKHTFDCLNLKKGQIYNALPFDEKRLFYLQAHRDLVFKSA